jgi:diadenosine tetraphosphatase ApaH/serine/threonine PP2A family protein phosphatase
MVNVGSVGQPRDGDNRACYLIVEDSANAKAGAGSDAEGETSSAPLGPTRLFYRRIPYDFEATIEKIYAISELEPFLGDRLRQGR